MIYLDNSSTTRQADEVTDVMTGVMKNDFGNPSSLHDMGLRAEKRVEDARRVFAATIGADAGEVFFNSCGTEGSNMIFHGAVNSGKHRGNKIITTEVEHPAVLETCRRLEHEGVEVVRIGVDPMCRINMDDFVEALDDKVILVSVMTVNNETGTIMPVKEIAEIAHSYGQPGGKWDRYRSGILDRNKPAQSREGGDSFWEDKRSGKDDAFWRDGSVRGVRKNRGRILVHTDAVQAYGKVDLRGTGADLMNFSGHKFHGPKGTGAVYIKKGIRIPSYITGGGQEKNLRSGTENVPGIAGLGEAARLAYTAFEENVRSMAEVRNYLLNGIIESIDDIRINSPQDGCPSILNVSFRGTRGEVILHTLEEDGIFVSTGSACSSNKANKGSHVLQAMGLSKEEIEGALRFSFSRYNTREEMDFVLDRLKKAVKRFRKLGKFR